MAWFRSRKRKEEEERLTVDDLIVLERFDEAEDILSQRIQKNAFDIHAHLRLAEVCIRTKQLQRAVDEYSFVASEYARDGFYDKAIAILAKVLKLDPTNSGIPVQIDQIRQAKRRDNVRRSALEGLLLGGDEDDPTGVGTSAIEIEAVWTRLSRTPVIERLSSEQLKSLFGAMRVVTIPESEVVVAEGESLDEAFLLVKGKIEAVVHRDGAASVLRSFGAGDLIGEAALLEQRAWPATYRGAAVSTKLLALSRTGLERALQGNSDPRNLIDAIRAQDNDAAVAKSVRGLSR